MFKLKASLRKVSRLETELSAVDELKAKFKFHYESLKDKTIVLDKKCNRLKEQELISKKEFICKDRDAQKLEEKIKAFNSEYSRLFKEYKLQENRLKRFVKYRAKMTTAAKSLKSKHKQTIQKFNYQNIQYSEVQKKLEETTEYIQEQNKNHLQKQTLLTKEYGKQSIKMKTTIETLSQENKELKNIYKKNVILHNQMISTNRKYEELSEDYYKKESASNKTIQEHKEILHQYKLELKNQGEKYMEQNEKISAANKKMTVDLELAIKEKTQFKEQVEILQKLWNEQNDKQEKLTTKNNSLQKLNQSLSLALNKYRCQIQELKNQTLKPDSSQKTIKKEQKEAKMENIDHIQSLITKIEAESNF